VKEPRDVDELVNDCNAVHELAFAMFSESEVAVPPICEPSVPEEVIDEPTARDEVATVEWKPFEPMKATP
jgi:hypothetical protein